MEFGEREALRAAATEQENEFRGLFARHRDSWEVRISFHRFFFLRYLPFQLL